MIFSLNNCVKYTIVSHSEYLFIFSKLNIKSKTLIYHNLINSSTNIWPNLQSVKTGRFCCRCFSMAICQGRLSSLLLAGSTFCSYSTYVQYSYCISSTSSREAGHGAIASLRLWLIVIITSSRSGL